MSETKSVHHVGIGVRSLETARVFYDKLGFRFAAGPVGPEPVAIMTHPSGVNVNLILNTTHPSENNILTDVPGRHTGYTHMALEVSDLSTVQGALADESIDLHPADLAAQIDAVNEHVYHTLNNGV